MPPLNITKQCRNYFNVGQANTQHQLESCSSILPTNSLNVTDSRKGEQDLSSKLESNQLKKYEYRNGVLQREGSLVAKTDHSLQHAKEQIHGSLRSRKSESERLGDGHPENEYVSCAAEYKPQSPKERLSARKTENQRYKQKYSS